MSPYEFDLNKLRERRCRLCQGIGKVTNAAPGNISFNTYSCHRCNGTGYKDYHAKHVQDQPQGDF